MRFGFCVLSAALLLPGPALASTMVIYPGPESPTDQRAKPYLDILRTALDKTRAQYGPYRLAPSEPMSEARYMAALASHDLNIGWSSTSVDKERQFIPIRIPLDKGLLGYRIALIAKPLQNKVDRVKTREDLARFTVGQGLGWGDIAIYKANGIPVQTSSYENLFRMVEAGRFDLFPRGIGEAFREYDQRAKTHPKLAVEQHLALYYPWPYYFFFNLKDKALAKRVEAGMRMMLEDGSYDALFHKHYGRDILRAKLPLRRVIRLENPLLPKSTPLQDARLWHVPPHRDWDMH